MKKSFLFYILLIFIISFSTESIGQSIEDQIDELLTEKFKSDEPGGTALVIKEGEVIYRRAFGKANLELDVDMEPEYIFRIGSITKQFTAPAISEGVSWPKDDHSIFVQFGRPAIAVSSQWFINNIDIQDITHTAKDNVDIVDITKLPRIAEALKRLIEEI